MPRQYLNTQPYSFLGALVVTLTCYSALKLSYRIIIIIIIIIIIFKFFYFSPSVV